MNILKELVYRLRGEFATERLVKMGMKVAMASSVSTASFWILRVVG